MEKRSTETSQRRMVRSIKRPANEKFLQHSFETSTLTELFKKLRAETPNRRVTVFLNCKIRCFPDTKLKKLTLNV